MLPERQKQLLEQAFLAGVEAVKPASFMGDIAQKMAEIATKKKVHLLALGKAAGEMSQHYLACGGPAETGLVILPDNVPHALPEWIKVIAASHPVPNQNSVLAAQALLAQVSDLSANDAVVMLLSGGGSSLACAPAGPLTLADKMAVNEALLASGAPIQKMNIVRKHLSALKGGRLAAAAFPATIYSFAISDVPDDDPAAIASGPTYGDDSTKEEAAKILADYHITLSESVHNWLSDAECESPFADDNRLANHEMTIVASARIALQAVADKLADAGYQPVLLGDDFQDDSQILAQKMADIAANSANGIALISGGETSVNVTGAGCGGRNAEFAHAMAVQEMAGICGLAGDSDGIDGGAQVAASFFDETSLRRAAALGLDGAAMLHDNDSHSFFAALDDQLITGPTQTNINDIRILLIGMPDG